MTFGHTVETKWSIYYELVVTGHVVET